MILEIALATCCLLIGADPLEVKLKVAADRFVIATDDDRTEIRIESTKGIGKATLKRTEAEWPKKVRLSIGIKGLEGLTIVGSDRLLRTSLKNEGPELLRKQGDRWEPVKLDPALTPTITQSGEEILIDLPPGWLIKDRPEITVEWIDFYRG